MKRALWWGRLCAALIGGIGCAPAHDSTVPADHDNGPPVYGFEIRNTFPHDRHAFTQGLQFHDGILYESTGLHGQSTLRQVDYQTGRVQRRVSLPERYFGEGIAIIEDRVFMLTWRQQTGFIFDRHTFRLLDQFRYEGEGWGLAFDGTHLVLSDGTPELRLLHPGSMEVVRTITVTAAGEPVPYLNELAWIEGQLWANIFQSKRVALIDLATGAVDAWIDFSGIRGPDYVMGTEDVLNGIAYDEDTGRIFVTGKWWPYLFEIGLRRG